MAANVTIILWLTPFESFALSLLVRKAASRNILSAMLGIEKCWTTQMDGRTYGLNTDGRVHACTCATVRVRVGRRVYRRVGVFCELMIFFTDFNEIKNSK